MYKIKKTEYCPTCKKSVPLLLGVDYEDWLISVCAISNIIEVNKKLAENCDYNKKTWQDIGSMLIYKSIKK